MKLSDWLRVNGKTATWLAGEVGRDASFITRVKNGDAMPSIEVAAAIQRITDGAVTAVDFVRPEIAGPAVSQPESVAS